MKLIHKWQHTLLLLLSLAVVFSSCENNNEPEAVLSITNINPTTAPIGSTVAITGTQFNTTPASNTVTFGGNAVANVITASATQLVVTVPANAQNGPVTITTGSGRTATSTQSFQLGARSVVQVQGEITASTTWTKNNVYLIRGFVYVTNGNVLTIEPGTVIKGAEPAQDPSGQQRGGTLIIEKGARIEAKGTAAEPIVFTSNRAVGQRGYGNWGGIVLIGRAPHNRPASFQFEGGIRGSMGSEAIANDNSGTLRYVRIEFAGIALSNANNSEINGLTLYAVGSGTTIDHVQVSYSGDDAYEWFGGTVNATYLVAHRTFDDDWDTDWGYTGKVQFALSLRDPAISDQSGSNGFESDNFNPGEPATAANTGLPLTAPIFANVSNFAFSGAPSTAFAAPASGAYQSAMHLRRNTAISIYNSVFSGYPEGLRLDGTATLANATAGTMDLRGITLANVGIANSTTSIPVRGTGSITDAQAQEFFNATARNNQVIPSANVATLLLNASNFNLASPNFLPQTGSPLLQGAVSGGKLADPFFMPTTYRGAFGAENWLQGWTNFDPQNTNYN